MTGNDQSEYQYLSAGDFAPWLAEMNDAILGNSAANVPCGECTACCTSFQFVHIGPEEVDTLSHIPPELLFPAPLLPRGHYVLGYDERGHCPMLIDGRCSIYEHRPRTCRTYDCRVFPATGLLPEDKPIISLRAQMWQFRFPSEDDRTRHAAVRVAAAFLREHSSLLPDRVAPANSTQLAVLAIRIHGVFLLQDEPTGQTRVVAPDSAAVVAEVVRQEGSRSAPRAGSSRSRRFRGSRPRR